MAKPREAWRVFEDVVAQIHRQIAPNAKLLPNYTIKGQSGRDRQIDVAIEFTVNSYPMMLVVECKKYARRVGISEVEAFSRKLQDLKGAPRERVLGITGVMIAHGGFDAGALAIARLDGIWLRTVAEAKAMDWAALGFTNTMTFFALKYVIEQTFMVLKDIEEPLGVDLNQTRLFTSADDEVGISIQDSILESMPQDAIARPGPLNFHMQLSDSMEIEINGVSHTVTGFLAQGQVIAKRFDVPVKIAESTLMTDAHTNQPIYGQVVTQGVDWRDIARNFRDEDGQLVTAEEYETLATTPGLMRLTDETKQYVRLNLTYNANSG